MPLCGAVLDTEVQGYVNRDAEGQGYVNRDAEGQGHVNRDTEVQGYGDEDTNVRTYGHGASQGYDVEVRGYVSRRDGRREALGFAGPGLPTGEMT